MQYFNNEMTKEQAKAHYKTLALQLHPDKKSGSHIEFVTMQSQYESFLTGNFSYTQKDAKQEANTLNDFIKANEFVSTLDGVTIEVVGSWVWLVDSVKGSTYKHKTIIKENGFKYSRGKKRWYKAPDGYKMKKRASGLSFEKITTTYGYESKTIHASNILN